MFDNIKKFFDGGRLENASKPLNILSTNILPHLSCIMCNAGCQLGSRWNVQNGLCLIFKMLSLD
jgi:hypothetical protein